MKKATSRKRTTSRVTTTRADEMLPEYDFTGARANPYAARFAGGVTVVTLDPDVAKTFPDAASVNEALRALAKIALRKPKSPGSKRRSA